uniref:Ninjurin 1 n=1 Tax=Ornithorhynchus anatinus TaxID=9258 RepID=A0A6I8PK05_ORNAN
MDSAGPEEFELNGEVGAVERLPSRWRLGGRPINVNHYANKKSAAESMLDIALLMANASQLKAVIEQGPSFSFFTPLIVLISISLVLQVGVGVLLIFLGDPKDAEEMDGSKCPLLLQVVFQKCQEIRTDMFSYDNWGESHYPSGTLEDFGIWKKEQMEEEKKIKGQIH